MRAPREFGGLVRARLDRVSLFSILEHDYGLRIAHADEEVNATNADIHTARLSVYLKVRLCFVFDSRFFQHRARFLSMCWGFTDPIVTLY